MNGYRVVGGRVCLDCRTVPVRFEFGAQGESYEKCACHGLLVEGSEALRLQMRRLQRLRPSYAEWKSNRGVA